jgi:predicted N-acetyltransferase YhbS
MIIDYPAENAIAQLRNLWKEAFGDGDAFLDAFFSTGFSPDRCRCVTLDGQIAAALYWFDCSWEGKPLAYLYAVATGKAYRGQGLCHRLMANTHEHLKYLGYAGAVLVPGESSLFDFYGKMGYEAFGSVEDFVCQAEESSTPVRKIDAAEYARLRRNLLPQGGIVQEGDLLRFLSTVAEFYAGEDYLTAGSRDGSHWHAQEFLGDIHRAPGLLAALGLPSGHFRAPGKGRKNAMLLPFSPLETLPSYLGLPLD